MFPEIASLGPFTLHTYGLTIALGVFLAVFWMTARARKNGFPPPEKVFDLVFVATLSGFIGARIFFVVQEGSWYLNHPLEIFEIWKGGLVYYGGMAASFIGFIVYVRLQKLPILRSCDFMMPFIALVHAFGRAGCFLNGCCYGKPCVLPWAVRFPALTGPLHPVQLYEALFNLALFAFLLRMDSRKHFAGEVTSFYLMLYAAGRFFLEFFRGGQAAVFFSFTLPQAMSLGFMGAGILLYGFCRSRR